MIFPKIIYPNNQNTIPQQRKLPNTPTQSMGELSLYQPLTSSSGYTVKTITKK